jgi:hypothetical protein
LGPHATKQLVTVSHKHMRTIVRLCTTPINADDDDDDEDKFSCTIAVDELPLQVQDTLASDGIAAGAMILATEPIKGSAAKQLYVAACKQMCNGRCELVLYGMSQDTLQLLSNKLTPLDE